MKSSRAECFGFEQYRLAVQRIFRMWRRCTQDSDARRSASSIPGASSTRQRGRCGGKHQYRIQRHAGRQRSPSKFAVSSSKASNAGQDFPFANVCGVCIKCGDGWLVGSWQRRQKFGLLPTATGPVGTAQQFSLLNRFPSFAAAHCHPVLRRHLCCGSGLCGEVATLLSQIGFQTTAWFPGPVHLAGFDSLKAAL